VIAVMLKALPEVGHCICIDRAAPVADDLVANSRLHIIAPQVLEFTPREARQLIVRRLHYAASYLDLAAAQGRAADLATYAHQVAVTAAQALADDAAFDRNSYESAAGVEPPLVKISVLAAFRVEVDGRELELGAKAPIKSLDILRALAIAPTRSCALADLYEWFWPDADGDLAKAACDQALHRLRKLLGNAAQVTQRNGRVHLRGDNLCIDLDEWEVALQAGLRPLSEQQESERGMEDAFRSFPGPLVECDRSTPWMQSAAERVRGKFIELTARLARAYEGRGAHARARALYLRAIDMYPTCSRCYESLIRGSLAQGDVPRAIEDYRRYERMLRASGIQPAVAIQSAIKQAMHAPLRVESTHQAFALA
jgi:DNA-binding SARP family transcriptional activator